MSVYIVKKENSLHIYPVTEGHDACFQAAYGQKILASGDTVREALTKLEEMPVIIESPWCFG
jgi:hypothetical protein